MGVGRKQRMNLVRQNTDYAFRLLVNLARRWPEGAASARTLSEEEDVSYQFACKILQGLHEAKLVESRMGPQGGYRLSRRPEEITMAQVVAAAQGPLAVNTCMLGLEACPRRETCPISEKLATLQGQIDAFFGGTTLGELARERGDGVEEEAETEKGSTL